MSRHTISNADRFIAGAGWGPKANPEGDRGLPASLPLVFNFGTPGANDPDAVATSQTPAGGGVQELTIDGVLATDGVATLTPARVITVTSSGNDTGRTFTVTGRDVNGWPMVEELAGPNAGAVTGEKAFSEITSVRVDADTAGAIQVGTGGRLGLPARSENLAAFFYATEDGSQGTGTFGPGSTAAQTATSADGRAFYEPNDLTVDSVVGYVPDRSRAGIVANYVG